jgi:plasmid maintenance system antidote protein VapI
MSNTTINQAKQILETHTSGEIAAALSIKSTNISPLKSGKRPLTEKMAVRIVGAFGGKATPTETPVKAAKKVQVEEDEKKAARKPPPTEKNRSGQGTNTVAREADAFLAEIHKREQLEKFGSIARDVISKVVKEEVLPALNEKIARAMDAVSNAVPHQPMPLEAKETRFPAVLIIPLYGGDEGD